MAFQEIVEELAARFQSAVARNDGEACAGIYSDDAVKVNPGGQVVQGRASIAGNFQDLLDSGEFNVAAIDVHDCRSDGNMGFAILLVRTAGDSFFVMLGLQRTNDEGWLIAQEVVGGN